MVSTLRQLQDLKEWAQDSTRYERRLNFRLAQKPYNWEEGNWWDLDDESVGNTKILEDFEITDEMRRRPNAEGGVQQLVQPGPGRQGFKGEGSGKSHWIYEPGSKNKKLKKEVVEDITKMMADSKNFPDKQTITKTFKYSGNPDKVLKMWAAETGNTIPEGRFRLHTYEGTDIQKNLVKSFEAQGDNPNIMKLAREYFPEMYKKKKTSATQQVRRILTEFADYVPRPNEPVPPGEEGYWKRRRKKINLALKRMGDTTIGEQMADQIWKENQKWIKLADENPDAILKNKKLRDALTITVDVDTGEIKKRNLTDDEILERVKRGDLFTEDHITEVREVETAPKKGGGTKLIKGHAVEYPINKQSVTTFWNQSFLPNARKYIAANPDGKNVKAIVKILDDYGLKLQVGDKTYGSTVEKVAWNSKKNISPRLQSNFDIFSDKPIPQGTKIPAGSSRVASVAGVLDDALKTKTAKKVGSFLTKAGAPFEAGFIVTDYYNNLGRGMSKEEAWQTALSNATFGIYEGGSRAREKGLVDLAQTQGYSDWQVDSLKTMMSYRKLQSEIKNEKAKLKWLMGEQESGVGSITGEDVAGAIEQQKNLISQMEKGAQGLENKYWEGMPEGENFNTGKMFDDLLGYKARQEYNETVEDRKHRVNPDMGPMGSPLWEALSDWRTFLPQNLMETTQATQPVVRNLRKLPGILGAMWDPTSEQAILSAMTPEEREERAAKLNIKRQTYSPVHQMSTMTYDQMDPYYADFGYMYNMAGGGIAGVRRPWAIPPASGPMPQGGGLSSQFNRVRKLTG